MTKTPEMEFGIGAVSRRTGIAPSALHFYKSKGLIESRRTAGNQRRYRRDVLRRVSLIKVAQRLGISLEEIGRAFAALPKGAEAGQKDWERLSRQWSRRLDARIDQLTSLRDQLADCIGCGCLSLQSCPLRNPEDELGRKGSGPHLLSG